MVNSYSTCHDKISINGIDLEDPHERNDNYIHVRKLMNNIITIIVLSPFLYSVLYACMCDYCRIMYVTRNVATHLIQFIHA